MGRAREKHGELGIRDLQLSTNASLTAQSHLLEQLFLLVLGEAVRCRGGSHPGRRARRLLPTQNTTRQLTRNYNRSIENKCMHVGGSLRDDALLVESPGAAASPAPRYEPGRHICYRSASTLGLGRACTADRRKKKLKKG